MNPTINDGFWVIMMYQVALVVKNSPINAGDVKDEGLIPGPGRSPGEGKGYTSNVHAWRIPWTEESDRLQSRGLKSPGG